mgnify:CR=1 FL=1
MNSVLSQAYVAEAAAFDFGLVGSAHTAALVINQQLPSPSSGCLCAKYAVVHFHVLQAQFYSQSLPIKRHANLQSSPTPAFSMLRLVCDTP